MKIDQGIGCKPARSLAAEARFRQCLADVGALLLEPQWLGSNVPHHVRCGNGHDCRPYPTNVMRGIGPCRTCSGKDPVIAEAAFRNRLAELGAVPMYGEWLGANRPHHVRCMAGHDVFPRPSGVQGGDGICRRCSHHQIGSPRALRAEEEFRARLAALGATPLYGEWKGTTVPHLVQCAAGHLRSPRPGDVQQGDGICRICASKVWDVFYVVTSPCAVKFGITSGDPRRRLADHARQGYGTVVRVVTGLLGAVAPDAEAAVKSALALAGEHPVLGKEYFDISCLGLILDVADPLICPASAGTFTSNGKEKERWTNSAAI
jgi:hypothetical protein